MTPLRLLVFARFRPEIAAVGGELRGREIGRKSAFWDDENAVMTEGNENVRGRFFNSVQLRPRGQGFATQAVAFERQGDLLLVKRRRAKRQRLQQRRAEPRHAQR